MKDIKIATMMFTWNGVGDRFLKGYFEPKGIGQIFPLLTDSLIKGVELQHPNHVNPDNIEEVKTLLEQYHLIPVIINTPMASDIKWKEGAFSHPSPMVRGQAVERVKGVLDTARLLGVERISIFLGQDGFDYPFVSNYQNTWLHLVDCMRECAEYAPDIKICIEYKPREPRTHQYLSSAAKTILLAEETGCKNVGLLIDIGHAWMAGENMGETICLASHKNRLFHVHMNDNYGLADDDLGLTGMHVLPYLEALYWLDRVNYNGWISLDVHSPREASHEIIAESAAMLDIMVKRLQYIGDDELDVMVNSYDGSKAAQLMNKLLSGKI